jgi:hypothetical protein
MLLTVAVIGDVACEMVDGAEETKPCSRGGVILVIPWFKSLMVVPMGALILSTTVWVVLITGEVTVEPPFGRRVTVEGQALAMIRVCASNAAFAAASLPEETVVSPSSAFSSAEESASVSLDFLER